MKYRLKPMVVEAITFDEFVEYGKNSTNNIVNEMPWSFDYNGYSVTHETDECYLILVHNSVYKFTPNDMLITTMQGETYPCSIDIFEEIYELSD